MKDQDNYVDINKIIKLLKYAHPELDISQLQVANPDNDDDGIWYFKRPSSSIRAALESSCGNCPFTAATNYTDKIEDIITVTSVEDAVDAVEGLLGYKKRGQAEAKGVMS